MVIGVDELNKRYGQQLIHRISERLHPCRIQSFEIAVEPNETYHLRRGLEQTVQFFPALAYCIFRLFSRSHVHEKTHAAFSFVDDSGITSNISIENRAVFSQTRKSERNRLLPSHLRLKLGYH